jgi:hypothetical protein
MTGRNAKAMVLVKLVQRVPYPRPLSRFAGLTAAIAIMFLASSPLLAQAKTNDDQTTIFPASAVLVRVPTWIPVSIRPEMYWWWRKYGPWDYKAQSAKYRNFTSYNFGATGAAAKVPQETLTALARAAAPNPSDVAALDQPSLAGQFRGVERDLETLRKMVESDSRLIRIAQDFTWLKDDSNWPREDAGITFARWTKYRELFGKLKIEEGVVRTDDFPDAIFFVLRVKGLCIAGSSAGYVFSERPLGPLSESPVQSLDTEVRNHPERGFAYVFRLLEPNWYAFYELDW